MNCLSGLALFQGVVPVDLYLFQCGFRLVSVFGCSACLVLLVSSRGLWFDLYNVGSILAVFGHGTCGVMMVGLCAAPNLC